MRPPTPAIPAVDDPLPPLGRSGHAWLAPLLEAATPRAVALATVDALRALPGCRDARILWGLDAAEAPSGEPATLVDDRDFLLDVNLACEVLADDRPRLARDGRARLAIPLWRSGAVALLELESGAQQHSQVHRLLGLSAEPLQVADQRMRTALEVAELHITLTRLEHSEQVQRALFAISDLAASDRDMPELLKGIHAIVGTLMYAENFFIVRLDAEHGLIRFLYFVDVEDPAPDSDIRLADRERTLTWYVLHDGKPLRGDAEQLGKQISGPLASFGTDSHDWMGVPMRGDGVVQGAIVVQSYQPGTVYSAEDQAVLEFVGSHILTALDRKRGKEQLEESVRARTIELAEANRGLQLQIIERARAEKLQAALFQIAQLATVDIGEEGFYRSIHQVVGELINAHNFFIGLLSDDRTMIEFPYYVDDLERSRPARPLGRSLSEYVMRRSQPLLASFDDVIALERQGEVVLATPTAPSVCWLGVPLLVGDETIGLVVVQSYDPEVVYGASDLELLGFVASQIANSLNRRHAAKIQQQALAMLEERVQARTQELRQEISERERIEGRLKHEVMHDTLTGVPNRGYLRDRLDRVLSRPAQTPQRQCALLYLDVDRFKVINDSLGHLAGDEVLKEVARRLESCLRTPDLVARLAGDEFVILLEDVDVPATAIKVAQRVLDLLAQPLQVGGKLLTPSASVGIAIGDHHYVLADELLRDADTALYRAKSLGRNRYVLFDASLQREAIDVLALEAELGEALAHDQFEPHFQPIVRLATGETVGYEALLRWNHPTRGVLGPPDFLQVAEDSDAIEAIDWRMFELSCAAAARLRRSDTFLTINVSPRHLRHADFDTRLIDVLTRTGLAPTRLIAEVTEGSLLDDPVRVRGTLGRLQDAGIGAALDDFGTGYSSLSYLHAFPLRMLKIDRSFVVELGSLGKENSASIMTAILALARALDMGVIAEGIETQEQRTALLGLGCDYGQGFLLGRPAPMANWLALEAPAGADARARE